MIPIAFDCETFLIGPGEVLPKMVCASFAWRNDKGEIETALFGNSPLDELPEKLLGLLENADYQIVTHNGSFDWGVAMSSYPQLTTAIYDAMVEGRCTDTKWREKLLNLSTTGKLDKMAMPDGSSQPILYGLANLVMQYLDMDISSDKDDEGAWRLNYNVLDGYEASDYPEDAARYARNDAELTLRVYEGQEARKRRSKIASTQTEEFQLAASFALNLMTAWGMRTDPVAIAEMRTQLTLLMEENQDLLIERGLLIPATEAAPMMRNGKPVLDRKAMKEAGDGVDIPKMKAAQPAKGNDIALQTHVRALYKKLGQVPQYTGATIRDAQGKEHDRISLAGEILELLADCGDEVIVQYHVRQSVKKLVTNQLPVLESGPVIYPNYDVLKGTGRTSSFGSPKGKAGLYPATNIQQVPNEIRGFDPRRCYIPREGTVFFDADYTALELACVGQVTKDLLGKSVHLERYNQGYDLHAYLGSQLALGATDGIAGEFAQQCRNAGIAGDADQVYDAFMLCRPSKREEVSKFFKHYRNFAKPVGLGFPGGLGPDTMVSFARQTYGVILTAEQAGDFRDMWRDVYPEMPLYFDWLNSQTDDYNDSDGDGWKSSKLYTYTSAMGMARRGASFCAAANGYVMQTPGGEAAKAAVIMVSRECYDPSMESVLFGCRPIAFVHDQIIGETTKDETLWHAQAMRVRDIMCEAAKGPLPDIEMRSDDAHLTSVWTKSSEPCFDENQNLIPWTPTRGTDV
jgi:DNA polymerase I-like protein with 3'-5' exonuclease and polymerase domains